MCDNLLGIAAAWKDNSYLNVTQAMAQSLNLMNCWVCTAMPRNGKMELPLMGIPIPYLNWSWPYDNFQVQPLSRNDTICWKVPEGKCLLGQSETKLPSGETLCWGMTTHHCLPHRAQSLSTCVIRTAPFPVTSYKHHPGKL